MTIQYEVNAPLDYFFHAYGPAARPAQMLGWVFTGICVAVCISVTLLLAAAIFRRRPEVGQYIARGGEGMRFIAIGTGISMCVLLAMTVYMLVVLNTLSAPPSNPALTIVVTGYDWWWKAEYPAFETANEIHIPTGVPILIKLASADVIHAFWVPQLAGKTQMIPGMVNQQWLQADKPGVYRGQCTQFCGAQHAHMAFEVVAESPEAFQQWYEAQRRPAAATSATGEGQRIFMKECAACHTIRGTQAIGLHGPDLTHLISRRMLAAGLTANTPDHLMDWVQHVQERKPGARMPDFSFSHDEAAKLAAYMATLK